eukprot:1849047-Karenia_brevis.AAC.1
MHSATGQRYPMGGSQHPQLRPTGVEVAVVQRYHVLYLMWGMDCAEWEAQENCCTMPGQKPGGSK